MDVRTDLISVRNPQCFDMSGSVVREYTFSIGELIRIDRFEDFSFFCSPGILEASANWIGGEGGRGKGFVGGRQEFLELGLTLHKEEYHLSWALNDSLRGWKLMASDGY